MALPGMRLSWRSVARASINSVSASRPLVQKVLPAGVRSMGKVLRSTSTAPAQSSSERMRRDSADCVMWRSSAAREKLRVFSRTSRSSIHFSCMGCAFGSVKNGEGKPAAGVARQGRQGVAAMGIPFSHSSMADPHSGGRRASLKSALPVSQYRPKAKPDPA